MNIWKKKTTKILSTALVSVFIYTNSAFAAFTIKASYYGKQHHGRKTASGERFDMYACTAAHKKLPFGTLLKLTNLKNGKTIIVKINDRGPFVKSRQLDISFGAAKKLDFIKSGVGLLKMEIIDKKKAVEDNQRSFDESLSIKIGETVA